MSQSQDCNVNSVTQKMIDRSNVGFTKYATTTERGDLSKMQWLTHAQEEAMDFAIYLEKLIQIELGNQ